MFHCIILRRIAPDRSLKILIYRPLLDNIGIWVARQSNQQRKIVNNYSPKLLWLNRSGLGCFLNLLLLGILLVSLGLGWVVNGFLILLGVVAVTPIIGLWILRWWDQRNVIEDQCPVCSYEFTGFKGVNSSCPNCGETLEVKDGKFQRITPPGIVDVEVVDVSVKQFDEPDW